MPPNSPQQGTDSVRASWSSLEAMLVITATGLGAVDSLPKASPPFLLQTLQTSILCGVLCLILTARASWKRIPAPSPALISPTQGFSPSALVTFRGRMLLLMLSCCMCHLGVYLLHEVKRSLMLKLMRVVPFCYSILTNPGVY